MVCDALIGSADWRGVYLAGTAGAVQSARRTDLQQVTSFWQFGVADALRAAACPQPQLPRWGP